MKAGFKIAAALNTLCVWLSPLHWQQTILCSLIVNFVAYACYRWHDVKPMLLFAYNCFLKPFLSVQKLSHQSHLEGFYEGQADIYDSTRKWLLAGRSTMLRCVAAQLKQVYLTDAPEQAQDEVSSLCSSPPSSPYLRPTLQNNKKITWLDIGGGTGANVEMMNEYIPIDHFHKVFVIDITPSLCKIAVQRFKNLGWNNVEVLCIDALKFELPDEYQEQDVEVGLITLSYSLSMFPSPYAIVDKVKDLLSPTGLLGVVDFYVSGKFDVEHDPSRHMTWMSRLFWSTWFEFDSVYLHHSRREYLEYVFGTVKQLNCRNWVIKNVLGMPYYIFLGTLPSNPRNDFKLLGMSMMDSVAQRLSDKTEWTLDGTGSDVQTYANTPTMTTTLTNVVPQKTKSYTNRKLLSFEHVHGQGHQWRIEYDPKPIPGLTTYIYAFAWEDPKVDLEYLQLNGQDQMLILTSGGCNALEYALYGPQRIHCVDMNPCQGHLLELKIAAMTALKYEDVWQLFGEGHHPNFAKLLDTQMSPYLSPHAFQFWKENDNFYNFYLTGSSGLAIRAFKYLAKFKRLDNVIKKLCHSETLEDQIRAWEVELRPHFLGRRWIGLLNSYKFAWEALGVPKEQFEMLMSEGEVYDYIVNTFDPLIRKELLSKTSYFYHLCLNQCYADSTSGNCPEWMTKDGHRQLTESANLRSIRIHTKAIVQVLNDFPEEPTLTKAVVMDHMDWFSQELAVEEVQAFQRKMKKDGRILIRSSSKSPWYLSVFQSHGFKVLPLGIRISDRERQSGKWDTLVQSVGDETLVHECIDRVNMYASFYMAIKE